MNTMEITKVVGGVAGSLLILMLLKLGADAYYLGENPDYLDKPAYSLEVADAAPAADVVVIPFAEVLAAADAAKGQRIFGKCAACHSVESGVTKVGPSLAGIVGRAQASEDFGYSDALTALGGDWTPEALNEFLTKPSNYAPGTAMGFSGLKKETDRANLIAYLETI